MDKKDFLESIDARDFQHQHEEEIDGVRVVHTGITQYIYDSDGKPLPREILEMYDANGNRFYSNCSSREESEELVAQLKKEGKDAVIGPVAPARDHRTGSPIKNQMKDWVGVYIVKQKEEKEVETEKEPAE